LRTPVPGPTISIASVLAAARKIKLAPALMETEPAAPREIEFALIVEVPRGKLDPMLPLTEMLDVPALSVSVRPAALPSIDARLIAAPAVAEPERIWEFAVSVRGAEIVTGPGPAVAVILAPRDTAFVVTLRPPVSLIVTPPEKEVVPVPALCSNEFAATVS
jgi:hypothetical protein